MIKLAKTINDNWLLLERGFDKLVKSFKSDSPKLLKITYQDKHAIP